MHFFKCNFANLKSLVHAEGIFLLMTSAIIYLLKWVVEFSMVKSVSGFLNHPFSIVFVNLAGSKST
jgi:hypothetical protein